MVPIEPIGVWKCRREGASQLTEEKGRAVAKNSQAVRGKDPTIAGRSVGAGRFSGLAIFDSELDVESESDAESALSPLADRRLSEEDHGCSQFTAARVDPSSPCSRASEIPVLCPCLILSLRTHVTTTPLRLPQLGRLTARAAIPNMMTLRWGLLLCVRAWMTLARDEGAVYGVDVAQLLACKGRTDCY